MNIRQAILRAADSIEQHPELFSFSSTANPDHDCGTPGCALGWIAHHAGISNWSVRYEIADFLGLKENNFDAVFYKRMRKFERDGIWSLDAQSCADCLRRYADKHHPDAIPADVRAIFEVPSHA